MSPLFWNELKSFILISTTDFVLEKHKKDKETRLGWYATSNQHKEKQVVRRDKTNGQKYREKARSCHRSGTKVPRYEEGQGIRLPLSTTAPKASDI